MRMLKQSTAANVMVFLTDSSDHITGKAGLTLTITASKDGAAFASITPTVTERGNGWYSLALTTAHTDTLGDLAVHVTGSGADPSDFLNRVIAVDLADSVRAGLTALPNAAANANGGLPILSSSGTTLAYTVSTVTTLTNLPAITTDWLTGTGVAASAVTKIQAGLATPTNITAGTITTVTTLTNLPAVPTDWLTAAGVKADAVTKIQTGLATPTNITAATGIVLASGTHTGAVIPSVTTVGSVTGNLGGNVVGSVGSIGTGGIASASFAAGAITAAAIAADAIGASELAADAVAEIQSGLSTLTEAGVRTAVGMTSADLDSQLDAILAAASGGGGLDAAGMRAALGMESANLDTQLGTIDGNIDSILSTVSTNLDAAITSRLAPTVAGRTLDVSTGGEAGLDWANVGSPGTTVNLSATTISTTQSVASVSGSVGSVTATVTLPSIPSNWITAAGIAADAIGASELADTAVAAIADGMLGRNIAGGLDGGRTVKSALYFLRNKFAIVGSTMTVYETDDSTESWTSAVATTPGDPISSSNPA